MSKKIRLEKADREQWQPFARDIQRSFAPAVEACYGPLKEAIPSDEEIKTAFADGDLDIFHILWEEKGIGGAVVRTNTSAGRGSLELFFILPEFHSLGLGLSAWQAIESTYPEIRVWETITPYFEQRNIHFYVNKCGFHIVEFFNKSHPGQELPKNDDGEAIPGTEAFFRFEKIVKEF